MPAKALLLILMVLVIACHSPNECAGPAPWSLTFEYEPSGKPAPGWSVPWTATIDASGRCTQSLRGWSEEQNAGIWIDQPERTLPAADVLALKDALQAARFDELLPSYGDHSVTDHYSMTLVQVVDGVAHRVYVYAPGSLAWAESQDGRGRDAHPGKRFLSVVVEFLRRVPSPIAQQTPESFGDLLARP